MVQEEKNANGNDSKKFGYGYRHIQILLMFTCLTALFVCRSSLAVAVLAMTDVSRQNDTNVEIYDWDKKTQSLILSSFFWGYTIMQIPAGLFAKKYGGKLIILIALLSNGVLCLVLPTLAHHGGWISVCICRLCTGLTQACLFPASHTMLGLWLPPRERTALATVVYGGQQLGITIAMPISGLLAQTALGWKSIFYFTAVLTLLTACAWYWFAASSPAAHRKISDEETDYIERELYNGNDSNQIQSTPWIAMFRSMPLWAIQVAHIGYVIAFNLFFLDLPTYLDKALHISLKNSANLSALPYISMWVGSVLSGYICEKLFNRGIISLVACRKIFSSFALSGAATAYIVLSFVTVEQKGVAVIAVMAVFFFLGFAYSGFIINHLDLSPQFGGVTLSITNFVGSIFVLLTPVVTSIILQNDPTNIANWRIVFLGVAGLVILSNIFYIIFGSADRQPWDSQESCGAQKTTIDEMEPLKMIKTS